MIVTPSSNSSFIAGVGLWSVGWSALFKLDRIPVLKRLIDKERTLSWINKNKVLTLLLTEAINFGSHGVVQASAVTLALGGTACNIAMLFVFLPLRQWRKGKQITTAILQGVAS